ncbi:MAG: hypothetical protein C0622_13215 [Desulfuromonas sp.]|nr:MAG: hypothetical protein C0622_13215 [Desulfuromonas sp.]
MVELEIVQLAASEMKNFSYLIYCPETLIGAAVDPSLRPEVLIAAAEERGVTLKLLLNTHGHRDHTAGNALIREQSGAQLAAHRDDVPEAEIPLGDGNTLEMGSGRIEVLHTPGHSPGSLVFKCGAQIITGDTLFVSRCGRADLNGSDVRKLYTSLQRLKKLPPETHVWPGHDYGPTPSSTLGWELEHNDFIRCTDLESFIRLRMG